MKEKEEILAKYFPKNILSKSNENSIFEAMDEYASEAVIEVAIDFAEWLDNNPVQLIQDDVVPNNFLTKNELFEIFLDETENDGLSSYVRGE